MGERSEHLRVGPFNICGDIMPLRRLNIGRNHSGRRRNPIGRDLEEKKYSPEFMKRKLRKGGTPPCRKGKLTSPSLGNRRS